MAIKNASDLLVYARTVPAKRQITRIYVKDNNPITFADGTSQGILKINNISNAIGQIYDDISSALITQNTADDVLTQVAGRLAITYNYLYNNANIESITINGVDYKYREVRNYSVGLVPTIEIVDSQNITLNEDAIIIEVLTPGSSAVLDPVAFSTSASISFNQDLRDCTNKDSEGNAEYKGGLRSFEISTEALQSVNPDVPLDGTDFFKHLKERSTVNLSFSDRVRNIIRTNLTQSGVDGFLVGSSPITQTNLQPDPFGGSTASKLSIDSGTSQSSWYRRLEYAINSSRLEGKYVTWTFHLKGDPASPNNDEASFWASGQSSGQNLTISSFEILSGDGTITNLTSSEVKKITGLNTGDNNVPANWTRVRVTYKREGGFSSSNTYFNLSPGLGNAQVGDDVIYTSSWQLEFSNKATNYQDPTLITRWQGDALVSNINYESGVEDNLTCSASFTGTGPVFYNGLGPELIGDTEFNLPNPVGGTLNPASAYWQIENSGTTANSKIENGLGKFFINGTGNTSIKKTGILNNGDSYLLTYTIPSNSPSTGALVLQDASENDTDVFLDITVGTHKLQFVSFSNNLVIKRSGTSADVFMSSISLKKVL